jgi:hypothetical protein
MKYGEFSNVELSSPELDKLVARFGREGALEWIETLSVQKAAHGYKYKSDLAAILAWARKDAKKVASLPRQPISCKGHLCRLCDPEHEYACAAPEACGMSREVACKRFIDGRRQRSLL